MDAFNNLSKMTQGRWFLAAILLIVFMSVWFVVMLVKAPSPSGRLDTPPRYKQTRSLQQTASQLDQATQSLDTQLNTTSLKQEFDDLE